MRTRSVNRSKYRNYLLKSEEFLVTANDAFERARYNASVLNSVHAIISAADALLVFVKGFRYAGTRHEEAVELFSSIFPSSPITRKTCHALAPSSRSRTRRSTSKFS